MESARPPNSELHAALVGVLLAGLAAWLAMAGSLLDWAWDGRFVLGGNLRGGRVGAEGALFGSALLAGLAAGVVGAMLGIVNRRRARWSIVTGLAAGQGAALCVGAAAVAFAWLGGGLAGVLLPVTLGGAAFVAAIVVASILLLVPRREA